jgi:signal transduction histidine kinase
MRYFPPLFRCLRVALTGFLLWLSLPVFAAEPEETSAPHQLPGWPVILGNAVFAQAAVGDLDGDGRDEVAVGTRDGRLFLLDGDGSVLPGWPRPTANFIYWAPLILDLDRDGTPEIYASSSDGRVHGWHVNGQTLPGWPIDLGAMPVSRPLDLRLAGGGSALLCADESGRVVLFDSAGHLLPGWPVSAGLPAQGPRLDGRFLARGDVDGDGSEDILLLAGTKQESRLLAWSQTGEGISGFPVSLPGGPLGVAVDGRSPATRLACTTRNWCHLLDIRGLEVARIEAGLPGDVFTSSPGFLQAARREGPPRRMVSAATRSGTLHLLDETGRSLPGWPRHLGGFIYGLTGVEERRTILGIPACVDVDGDGAAEILVGSYDQHLYCFEQDGSLVPGWSLPLGDAICGTITLAQLDGVGPREIVVPQAGETVFAFGLGPGAAPATASARQDAVQHISGEMPWRYWLALAVMIMGASLLWWMLLPLIRSLPGSRPGTGARVLLVLLVGVLLVRGVLLVGEVRAYQKLRRELAATDGIFSAEIRRGQAELEKRTDFLAAALDSCFTGTERDPLRILYHLERLADRNGLDYRHTGLMVVGEDGRAVQTLGLARWWGRRRQLLPDRPGALRLLDELPVQTAEADIDSAGGLRLLMCHSLLADLPQRLADRTGFSVRVQLAGRSLAWVGAPRAADTHLWPWAGVMEPARELAVPGVEPAAGLLLRLAEEDFERPGVAWLDLGLLLALTLFLQWWVFQRRRSGFGPGPLVRRWPLLGVAAAVLGSWYLLTQGQFTQHPVPAAGRALEFMLALLTLFGVITALVMLMARHRGRRLSFALAGSYLVVSLLPLAVVLVMTSSILQQAQRERLHGALARLEQRADHLALAYVGMPKFQGELNRTAGEVLDQPTEAFFLDFVGANQQLFTYDLPSAYLTIDVADRRDSRRHFTGFSWRVPRTEKFFKQPPPWVGETERGLFLDRGEPIVRAQRTLRTVQSPGLDARIVAHLPFDGQTIAQVEESLRILPFLPRVWLEPAWLASAARPFPDDGVLLPFSTRLVLPARDWRTGQPRHVVFRARAYLPTGDEMTRVLLTLAALALFPLGLSAWGAYFTLRRTVRPLMRLLSGIRRVETGDLDYRLGATGQTEIAQAGRAFDRMAASLSETVRELAEKKKIEEISALKSHFISMVSHDLKTPLSSIQGAAENLLAGLAGPITERQQRYLEMVLTGSENLQRMIGDLLDLSRIESGNLQLETETLDLRREVEHVLRSLRPLLEERQLELHFAGGEDGLLVQADRTRLWQIVSNIVGNAVRHSPDRGRLTVTMARQGAIVRTTIADEGPGVPDDEQKRIFEPFYSRPAGMSGDANAGAGLGLAIVKQLVELHGGEVTLRNGPRGGASFGFTLPAGVGN